MSKARVMVGLSGGVDSSVAALLLREQGFEVHGLFMDNWEDDAEDSYCTAAQDFQDARQVAETLGIPLHKVNFAAEYRDRVFRYFLDEYAAGRTPNPDVLCNSEIKFKAFLDYALRLGAERIATGHYARIHAANGQVRLLKARDTAKDQSYFLHAVSSAALARSLFPLGDMQKGEVRERALRAGFGNHAKKDSTGICFIGERKFREFLSKYLPAQPGEMRTPDGAAVGRHQGLMYYTLGQRQGLGLGGRKHGSEAPWYVVGKDMERNILLVNQGEHPALLSHELVAHTPHWMNGAPVPGTQLAAKTRYRQADQACTLLAVDNAQFAVRFTKPQRAVTPGQYVVLYKGEECLGGGVIHATDAAAAGRLAV